MSVVYPPHWSVVKNPTTVFTVYVHHTVRSIWVIGSHTGEDCLWQACANIGRVCGVAFRPVANGPADIQVFARERSRLGSAGYTYPDPSPWIGIAIDAYGGTKHSVGSLVGIIQHEVCHKRLRSCGWPGGHSPYNVPCCMNPTKPLIARYPSTNLGVQQYGLAGFSRWEADNLATFFGTRWLSYVEPGL